MVDLPSSSRVLLHLRRFFIALLHGALIAVAWFGSFGFRLDFDLSSHYWVVAREVFPLVLAIKLLTFFAFGLFHGWWKYVGVSDLIDIALAATTGSVTCFVAANFLTGMTGVPRSVFGLDLLLTFLLVGGVRFLVRAYGETFRSVTAQKRRRVLIVGAGRVGTTLVREMRANPGLGYEPIAFVDDDPNKQGIKLHGVAVRGTVADLPPLIHRFEIDDVVLAIASQTGDVRHIMEIVRSAGASLKVMPAMSDVLGGRISVSRMREVQIEDLLGRPPIKTDLRAVRVNTEGHIVMITGAAGSIGSELSRQVATMAPAEVILVDRSESDLHDLDLMLRQMLPNVAIIPVLADIMDRDNLEEVVRTYSPSRVYHAAAYKHVWLVERHVTAAVRNNILGTCNVAECAVKSGVEQLVLISTDKAVRPTSFMGATKRAAERALLAMPSAQTRFTIVRFGNVLGSRGSVVPIFSKQIAMGGPVTVTHPDVVRYFMTIPEAVQLVLQAAAHSEGRDIFHLDMGDPVRIADLAANMIRLSGFEPEKDIQIQYVGLRPGEKLFEELLADQEQTTGTDHPRIRRLCTSDEGLPNDWIDRTRIAAQAGRASELLALIQEAVPDYTPSDVAKHS